MPAERGKDAAERFAAAVDKGRSPLAAGSDADLARELEIVAMLRSREGTYASHAEAMAMLRSDGAGAFGPRADEKARAKQRLMAALAAGGPAAAEPTEQDAAVVAFPQVAAGYRTAQFPTVDADEQADLAADVADEAAPGNVTPLAGRVSRRAGRHSMPATGRSRALPDRRAGLARRAGVVGSAAMLVMIAFTGAGVFASQDALLGQTLYPLKRAAEAASLAMTFDDEARAQRNLELAATRLSEVEKLIALSGASDVDPQLVRAAMSEFDVATNEGSRTLLSGQNSRDSATLQAWAATQSARLSALRPALPEPAVPAADSSIALLDQLLGRSGDASSTSLDRTGAGTADESRGENTAEETGIGEGRIGTSGGSTGGTPNATEDRPLEPLQPNSGPLSADQDVEEPAANAPADRSDDDPVNLPLPLPGAPVTLPPLLPGMPPLTIG